MKSDRRTKKGKEKKSLSERITRKRVKMNEKKAFVNYFPYNSFGSIAIKLELDIIE